MDIKEFLLTDKTLNRAEIARLMWPGNPDADAYLWKKLNETNGRRFTRKDAIKAKDAIEKLCDVYGTLTVADSY